MSALSVLRESGRGVRLGLPPRHFFGSGCGVTALVCFDSVTKDTAMTWLASPSFGQIDANGIRLRLGGGSFPSASSPPLAWRRDREAHERRFFAH